MWLGQLQANLGPASEACRVSSDGGMSGAVIRNLPQVLLWISLACPLDHDCLVLILLLGCAPSGKPPNFPCLSFRTYKMEIMYTISLIGLL